MNEFLVLIERYDREKKSVCDKQLSCKQHAGKFDGKMNECLDAVVILIINSNV
jgi:hypothetical protein